MKFLITILLIFESVQLTKAQNSRDIVDKYIESVNDTGYYKLNHNPIVYELESFGKITIFFVYSADGSHSNFGIIYNPINKSYTQFGENDVDVFNYSPGVISVFFENLDDDQQKELIVLYESQSRTYYSANGGYAGIKSFFQTRVFNIDFIGNNIEILEYKAMGELLTVNPPKIIGTIEEESLILREDYDKLYKILGVTHNADAIRKRIKMLKDNGMLGAIKK
ncbi:hypothetical protein [Maribellus maritimus]|uniref:hypothetical protein n=1 Tax=Maribellus maritimus TaxID=2870838 RepID=UPI001EEAF707|nr:hypothetical protein [Maribellus maritimus]MCG6191407.1 hypothetical protein [Maribellus maritimus]